MRFTSQVRYAAYALFDMAYHDPGAPHQVKTISRRQGIPPRYLEQIFQRLLRGGILRSRRGPRGGYTLARAAKDISIGDVVRATEGSIEALFNGRPEASSRRRGRPDPAGAGAPTRRGGVEVWSSVTGRVAELLNQITVEDLVHEAERRGLARESSAPHMYFI
jgi:Rrf2 family iron-sulfur cluster assembly transcriptional regulator